MCVVNKEPVCQITNGARVIGGSQGVLKYSAYEASDTRAHKFVREVNKYSKIKIRSKTVKNVEGNITCLQSLF